MKKTYYSSPRQKALDVLGLLILAAVGFLAMMGVSYLLV